VLKRDLTRLSSRVLEAAIVNPNGEGRWPAESAFEAINELADTGSVILGVGIWLMRRGRSRKRPLVPTHVVRPKRTSSSHAFTRSRRCGGCRASDGANPHSRHLGRPHLTPDLSYGATQACRVHALLPSSGRAGQASRPHSHPLRVAGGITIDRPFPSRIVARSPWEPPLATRSLAGKRDRFRGQHLDVLVRQGDTELQIGFKYSTLDAQRGEFHYLALDLTSAAIATNIESS